MDLEIKELDLRSDDRGLVAEILKRNQISQDIKEILFGVSKPGVIRGNHYHKSKVEWLCVIKGKGKLIYQDIESGEKKEIIVSGDKPVVVKTPVNAAHSHENIGDTDEYWIEITNQIYDEVPDTFKKQVL
jgi:UDP-2-acetamido-2,6-beta-L-arabino-hexul-4-ose reductase